MEAYRDTIPKQSKQADSISFYVTKEVFINTDQNLYTPREMRPLELFLALPLSPTTILTPFVQTMSRIWSSSL